MHAPQGSRFFPFDIQIFQNIATLGVGASPPQGWHPLQEILDPTLICVFKSVVSRNISSTLNPHTSQIYVNRYIHKPKLLHLITSNLVDFCVHMVDMY